MMLSPIFFLNLLCRQVKWQGQWLVEGDSSKRMDLLRFSGGVHWNDISVVNPVAPSYVRASQRIGGAIERRERDKKRKWDLVAARRGASFTPTVLEATGRRSELTKALFKELAVSAAEITEEDVSTGRRKDMFVSRVVGEITQHVSVAMAHCNALLIEEAAPCTVQGEAKEVGEASMGACEPEVRSVLSRDGPGAL